MNNNSGMFLNTDEGKVYWVLGDLYAFKATGRQTNGAFTVVDQIIQPHSGPPPHIHHKEDEAFYVLEGSFTFLCGNQHRKCEAGSFVYVPKGTLHTFENTGDHQGRLLVFITPAGLEEFFYAIGTPAENFTSPPPLDPSIFDKLMRLAKEYHMDIVTGK